jgi:hypothetical protein
MMVDNAKAPTPPRDFIDSNTDCEWGEVGQDWPWGSTAETSTPIRPINQHDRTGS